MRSRNWSTSSRCREVRITPLHDLLLGSTGELSRDRPVFARVNFLLHRCPASKLGSTLAPACRDNLRTLRESRIAAPFPLRQHACGRVRRACDPSVIRRHRVGTDHRSSSVARAGHWSTCHSRSVRRHGDECHDHGGRRGHLGHLRSFSFRLPTRNGRRGRPRPDQEREPCERLVEGRRDDSRVARSLLPARVHVGVRREGARISASCRGGQIGRAHV